MKDNYNKKKLRRASVTSYNSQEYINGVIKARVDSIFIRKKKTPPPTTTTTTTTQQLLIRLRLKEYLLYSKLKSLIPSSPHHQMHNSPSGALEIRELDESQERLIRKDVIENERVDEQDESPSSSSSSSSPQVKVETRREVFVGSVRIKRMEDAIQISTIVEKDVCLTSTLFGILEEEKLDIVFENQYRTETRVAHTIQVRTKTGYDIDGLEKKLRSWAGYTDMP